MYETQLGKLERIIITRIIREYQEYRRRKDDPLMRYGYSYLENEEDFLKRFESVKKRYGLLTEKEKEKYEKYV